MLLQTLPEWQEKKKIQLRLFDFNNQQLYQQMMLDTLIRCILQPQYRQPHTLAEMFSSVLHAFFPCIFNVHHVGCPVQGYREWHK